jgi:1,4-dihydroxy-2-naphthoate octaprenyltransferase
MKTRTRLLLDIFIQPLSPINLLAGVLLYGMGGGLVHYLGTRIDWGGYWLGLACAFLLQICSSYLRSYFLYASPGDIGNKKIKPSNRKPSPKERVLIKRALLQISITLLTVGAVLTVILFLNRGYNFSALILLGAAFLLAYFYAVPPIRLAETGFGELTEAILVTGLVPALAFVFQTGELHRILAMLTFPITAVFLAMLMVFSLQEYASDIKYNRKSIMIRLGWENGMVVHNLLLLISYLILGIGALLGLPWQVIWPALLSFPIAIFQVLLMNQISNGAKPRWKLFIFTSRTTFFLTAYLLTITLWTG